MSSEILKFTASILPTIFFIECFIRLKILDLVKRTFQSTNESIKTIGNAGLSDDQKQNIILRNSVSVFSKTMKVFLYILIICFGALSIFALEGRILYGDWDTSQWVMSLDVLIYCCIVGVVYSFIRSKVS